MSQPVNPSTPTQPSPTVVTDPNGSGATFAWGGSTGVNHIPKPGDEDYLQYSQALSNWLQQRYQAYLQSPKYQQDQAANNPAIASGQVPAIGFRPEGPNAWDLPANSEVTSLTQQANGGYSIGYKDLGTMQKVNVQGPGYGFEGYVRAPSTEAASQMVLSGFQAQVAGVDVSPSKLGGYTASSGNSFTDGKITGGEAVVQVGDPERNAYWTSRGLPQYAAYSPPSLTPEQQSEGFYTNVTANGVAPQVTMGNTNWDAFWAGQGHPELSKYQPPNLQSNQYVFNPSVDSSGQLSYGIGDRTWEQQWTALGVTDINTIRGYQAPTGLPQGSYIDPKSVMKQSDGSLSYQSGNTNWEQQWANLGVTDINTIRGYAPPTLPDGGYIVKDSVVKTSEGVSYSLGNRITENQINNLNNNIATINQQNQKFTDAYNLGVAHPELIGKPGSGAISLSQYQSAMGVQTQNTTNLLNQAGSQGFISESMLQTDIANVNANMVNINALGGAVNNKPQSGGLPETYWSNRVNPVSQGPPIMNPLGIEPGTSQYNQQGSWLNRNPTKVDAHTSTGDAFGLISSVVSQPVEMAKAFLNPASAIVAKDNSAGGQVAQLYAGSASYYVNNAINVKDSVTGKAPIIKQPEAAFTNIPNSIPNPNASKFIPAYSETEALGYRVTDVGNTVIASVVLPVVAPEVLPIKATTILKAGAINAVVNQGVNVVFNGKPDLSPEGISQSFLIGEGVAVAGTGALKTVSKVDPSLAASRVGQIGINTAVGGGAGYVLSGGDPEQTVSGAVTAGLLSAGSETVFRPVTSGIKAKLGFTERLVPSEPTIGKAGAEVPTYISEKPVEALGGNRLRVVYDVTENPVGTNGVTVKSMQTEYIGKEIPTAHATLNAENFKLKTGGETILKGFPEEGSGYRAQKELYHFYSAPGSPTEYSSYGDIALGKNYVKNGYVNVYGGYAGMSQAEDSAFRLVVGGKPTVLATTGTKISPKYNPLPGESEAAYLARTSNLPGETGIAQETILGKSMERQFVTASSYERMGEQLVGSKFVSEGKAGNFQIQELPSGRLGKIPILRDMFSKYTDFTVVKGKYVPNEAGDITGVSDNKSIDLAEYNSSYENTVSASTPRAPVMMDSYSNASPKSISSLLLNREVSPYSDLSSGDAQNVTSNSSLMSTDNSLPSLPSVPISASDLDSQASYPSIPSNPQYSPSTPSIPSQPSIASRGSMPSVSSYPSIISIPSNVSISSNRSNLSSPTSLPSLSPPSYPISNSSPYSDPFSLPSMSPSVSKPGFSPSPSPGNSPPPSPFNSYFDLSSDQSYSKRKGSRGKQKNKSDYVSTPRDYPVLTGYQLLGKDYSGDEQPFF